ncbi:MAG: hypothetical protein A4E45_02114 [Methanosaeta sp. PtaB.Bin039]|nr:MAG: hypothetical protein A4E45_02114 [Methanosaeta sp. PtaB.Bin039]
MSLEELIPDPGSELVLIEFVKMMPGIANPRIAWKCIA